jgi:hypothetical protein
MKKIILFSVLASTLLLSCESKTYDDVAVTTVNPTYNNDIKPIFDNNCVSCHQAGGADESFLLDTYDLVKTATLTDVNGNGTVLCRIDASCGNVMPQSGKMEKSKIKLIQLWAKNQCPQ